MTESLTCFCGAPAALKQSRYGPFYGCTRWPECEGTVGCHPGTTKPLGTLANKAMKKARIDAHDAFDPLWREGRMTRKEAYRWMAQTLGVTRDEAHIGMLDEGQCATLIEAIEEGFG